MANRRDSGLPVRATWPGVGEGILTGREAGFYNGQCGSSALPGRCPPSSRPSLPGEGEWFGWWGDRLDDWGGWMIARKSARGLAHYRTLRAEGCLPANEDWGKDKLWAARQRRPYQIHVRPHPGLLPQEKGNGSAGG